MRRTFLNFTIVLVSIQCLGQNNTWTKKANLPSPIRTLSVGFSIANNGYITTGSGAGGVTKDLWEWNQSDNTWTQKADIPGAARWGAVGFAIGEKGYVGTGWATAGTDDFWEWDKATNTWTQKAQVPGGTRWDAIGFSIGTKGYIGMGYIGPGVVVQDLWEWDQATDSWTRKSDLPISRFRLGAINFSIGTKGYVALGTSDPSNGTGTGSYKDLWEWDQATDTWIKKADFPGGNRSYGTGFSIGSTAYMGTGMNSTGNTTKDFWRWDQNTNTWQKEADFGGGNRTHIGTGSFAIGNKGYVGPGSGARNLGGMNNEFWEYQEDTTFTSSSEILIVNKLPFSLFPNPFNSMATIKFPNNFQEVNEITMEVYNFSGQKVKSYSLEIIEEKIKIYASEIGKEGVYFYTLKNGNKEISSGKFMITN